MEVSEYKQSVTQLLEMLSNSMNIYYVNTDIVMSYPDALSLSKALCHSIKKELIFFAKDNESKDQTLAEIASKIRIIRYLLFSNATNVEKSIKYLYTMHNQFCGFQFDKTEYMQNVSSLLYHSEQKLIQAVQNKQDQKCVTQWHCDIIVGFLKSIDRQLMLCAQDSRNKDETLAMIKDKIRMIEMSLLKEDVSQIIKDLQDMDYNLCGVAFIPAAPLVPCTASDVELEYDEGILRDDENLRKEDSPPTKPCHNPSPIPLSQSLDGQPPNGCDLSCTIS